MIVHVIQSVFVLCMTCSMCNLCDYRQNLYTIKLHCLIILQADFNTLSADLTAQFS